VTPISGAPRTHMSRMAVAMPSTVPIVSMRKSCGSQRWSMISTERPSSLSQMVR
jgi:hypothetical protein